MSLRKGLLRLTLVLSVVAGIAFAIVTMERYPYTLYEVRREIDKDVQETTVRFRWVGVHRPVIPELTEIFKELENPERLTESKMMFAPQRGETTLTVKEMLEGDALKRYVGNIDPFAQILSELQDKPVFTFLKESKHPIKWSKFVLQMVKGFASI